MKCYKIHIHALITKHHNLNLFFSFSQQPQMKRHPKLVIKTHHKDYNRLLCVVSLHEKYNTFDLLH